MELIKLSDFVLEKNEFGLFVKNADQIRQYAEFLQQELTLSMFLPCDTNGDYCPEPNRSDYSNNDEGNHLYNVAHTKYKQGRQKVLFENVTFFTVESQKDTKFYRVGDTQVFNINGLEHLYWHHYTIESLLSEMDETISFIGSF